MNLQQPKTTQNINPGTLLKAFAIVFAIWILIPILARVLIENPTQRWFWKDLGMAINAMLLTIFFLTIRINWVTIILVILGTLGVCTVLSDYKYIDDYDTIFVEVKLALSIILVAGLTINTFYINKRGT